MRSLPALVMMPEDRKKAGLFPARSVAANIGVTVLPQVSRRGMVSELQTKLTERFVERVSAG
jgi:ABC-type sugar transport system ATPase subunit